MFSTPASRTAAFATRRRSQVSKFSAGSALSPTKGLLLLLPSDLVQKLGLGEDSLPF